MRNKMGLTTNIKICEVCGKKSYYIYDSRELREENLCLNEECGYYYISFDKKTTFKPNQVSDTYVDVLNKLEGFLSEGEWTNEGFSSSNMKGIWKGEGFSSPEEVRELIKENIPEDEDFRIDFPTEEEIVEMTMKHSKF